MELFLKYNESAKSNVVNNNRGTPGNPPQQQNVDTIADFVTSAPQIFNAEFFARNIAALGECSSLSLDRVLGDLDSTHRFRGHWGDLPSNSSEGSEFTSRCYPSNPNYPKFTCGFQQLASCANSRLSYGMHVSFIEILTLSNIIFFSRTRATNYYNYYSNKMNNVLAAQPITNPPATVPTCFVLFHQGGVSDTLRF